MTGIIHATAVIDPSTEIAGSVNVGPFAIIEGRCRIGEGCDIKAHAVICRDTIIGPGNQIGYGAVIGADPQDFAYRGLPSHVEIGARNRIREYVTIHRATKENSATTIGDDNFLMGGVHLGHDTQVGNRVIMANNSLLAGHTIVEDNVFLGGATILHQYVRIGRLAITRGGTRLGKDVPPYFMAVATNQVKGLNRIGLRRAGFSPETRRVIQEAYNVIYRSSFNISQALDELRIKYPQPEVAALVHFVASSQRGICRERRADADPGEE